MNITKIVIHVLKEPSPLTLIPLEIKQEVEENLFLFLKRNRLLPLFYEKAKGLQGIFTPDFLQRLKEESRTNMLRMMHMEAVFGRLLTAFTKAGIPLIHIKGFSISASVYEKPFHRPMADIDFLVRPDIFAMAENLLMAEGAVTEVSYEAESAAGISFDKSFLLAGLKVELHHHLMNPDFKNTIAREVIFANTQEITLFGQKCQVLNREMQLFYLLHHFNRHFEFNLARMVWLLDIHYYLHFFKETTDWKLIAEFARLSHSGGSLYNALYLCAELFDDELPYEIPQCKNQSSIAEKYVRLCRGQNDKEMHIGSFRMLMRIKGWNNKWRFARNKFFPGQGYLQHYFGMESVKPVWKYYIRYYRNKLRKV